MPTEATRRLLRPGALHLFFEAGKQLRKRDAQASCNGERGLKGQIVFAALDATHVGPMEPAVVRKRLLRKTLLSPKLTDSVPEDDL